MNNKILTKMKSRLSKSGAKIVGIAAGGALAFDTAARAFAEKAVSATEVPGNFMSHVVERVGTHMVNYPTHEYRYGYGYGYIGGKYQYGYGYTFGQVDHWREEEYTYHAVDHIHHWVPGNGTAAGTCFQIGQEGDLNQKVSIVSDEMCKQTAVQNGVHLDQAATVATDAGTKIFNATASSPEGMHHLDKGVQIVGHTNGDVIRVATEHTVEGLKLKEHTTCELLQGNMTQSLSWDQGCKDFASAAEQAQHAWDWVGNVFGGAQAHGELASPQITDGFNQAAAGNNDALIQTLVVGGALAVFGIFTFRAWYAGRKVRAVQPEVPVR